MKKILFSIPLLFFALTCSAQTTRYTDEEYQFEYSIKKNSYISLYKYLGDGASFTIPAELDHDGQIYPITEISGPSTSDNGKAFIPSTCEVKDIFVPSSITSLARVTRDNQFLEKVIVENGDNITNCLNAFYFDMNCNLKYIIVFNNKNKKFYACDWNGGTITFSGAEINLNFFDSSIEKETILLFFRHTNNMKFNEEQFNYLISELKNRGTDINKISKIEIKVHKSTIETNSFTFDFTSNPANELAYGAKVIAGSTTYVSSNPVIPDKVNFTAPSSDITGTINYTRSNTLNWNSVCLPFDIKEADFGGNSKIYEVTSASSDAITLSRVATSETTIPAGTPCFIKSTDEQWDLTISDATISSSVSAQSITVGNYQVVGSFELKTIGANNYKLTADGSKFGITNKDDATVTPFRCYINPPSSSNAPAFINVNFDEEATITLIPNDAEPQKVKLYDLMGRPRKEATPGIFIKSTR